MSDMPIIIQNQTKPARQVAILGFEGVLLLDVAGPAQVFGSANAMLGWPAYVLEMVSEQGEDCVTDTGLRLRCDQSFATRTPAHDVIIPGGPGVDRLLDDTAVRNFLLRAEAEAERIISVCSGSLLTASAGLLDGRQATTHWERADMVQRRFAAVRWSLDQIFTHDGKFHCSAGVTAGIDLSLALVEQDHGRAVALRVAREMVVFMQRQGGQSQFSVPLMAQSTTSKRLSSLYSRIEANPAASWTVKEMARFAGTTERTLHRDFVQEFGQTPSRILEEGRMSLARTYLERSRKSVKEIASLSGFGTEQKLRRSFLKRLGVPPSEYRMRFGQMQDESGES